MYDDAANVDILITSGENLECICNAGPDILYKYEIFQAHLSPGDVSEICEIVGQEPLSHVCLTVL